jgi:hypothetical protein
MEVRRGIVDIYLRFEHRNDSIMRPYCVDFDIVSSPPFHSYIEMYSNAAREKQSFAHANANIIHRMRVLYT